MVKGCGRSLNGYVGVIGVSQVDNVWWQGFKVPYQTGLSKGTVRRYDGGWSYYNDTCGNFSPEPNRWQHFCRECAVKNGFVW